jgi:hypothetical protein
MPTPIFSFDAVPLPSSSATPLQQTKYRPSVSSPLSSSPIRASSYSPPISPAHDATLSLFPPQKAQHMPRDTQSSPIAQPSPTRKLFKFATRTPRPNPVVQKREEARESRRKLFLKNVRERADDKAWERRGGDQEVCFPPHPYLIQGGATANWDSGAEARVVPPKQRTPTTEGSRASGVWHGC